MKKTGITILFFLILISQAHSQENKENEFLYLYSDSIMYGKTIEFTKPVFSKSYFTVNEKKIESKKVKFYYNGYGLYANTSSIRFTGKTNFIRRTTPGKINLYVTTTTSYSSTGPEEQTTIHYYNKGYNDLKKVNYKNLYMDMSDNSECLLLLQDYKKTRNTLRTTGIVGVGLALGSMLTYAFLNNNNYSLYEEKNPLPYTVVGCTGGIMILTSSYLSIFNNTKILKSISMYNSK